MDRHQHFLLGLLEEIFLFIFSNESDVMIVLPFVGLCEKMPLKTAGILKLPAISLPLNFIRENHY